MADDGVKSEVVVKTEGGGAAQAADAVVVKSENGSASASDASATAAASSGLPQLDGAVFFRRLQALYRSWAEHKSSAAWGGANALCVLAGKPQPDESGYRKSAVLQIFLLGYLEFPETLMIFTPKTLYVLTAGKKCTFGVTSWVHLYVRV